SPPAHRPRVGWVTCEPGDRRGQRRRILVRNKLAVDARTDQLGDASELGADDWGGAAERFKDDHWQVLVPAGRHGDDCGALDPVVQFSLVDLSRELDAPGRHTLR